MRLNRIYARLYRSSNETHTQRIPFNRMARLAFHFQAEWKKIHQNHQHKDIISSRPNNRSTYVVNAKEEYSLDDRTQWNKETQNEKKLETFFFGKKERRTKTMKP